MELTPRGVFIVLEGIDRAGKTEQLSRVVRFLQSKEWRALPLAFPDRFTAIGQLIDSHLTGHQAISPECLHLLFSANRWEQQSTLRSLLLSGTSIVCDRYAYSGLAYSVGAEGLDAEWAMAVDRGIIEPDLVFQLAPTPEECAQRPNYGRESYEKLEIQRRVAQAFEMFHHLPFWRVIESPTPSELEKGKLSSVDLVSKRIYNELLSWLSENAKGQTLHRELRYISEY